MFFGRKSSEELIRVYSLDSWSNKKEKLDVK